MRPDFIQHRIQIGIGLSAISTSEFGCRIGPGIQNSCQRRPGNIVITGGMHTGHTPCANKRNTHHINYLIKRS
jgi:hypothetical protein